MLPAAATTKMPAAASAAVAGRSAPASQPSIGGQPHELVSTCGARAGRPSVNGSPAEREGRQHELQAVQVARRAAQVAVQVDAADPAGARGHADAVPAHRACPACGCRARRGRSGCGCRSTGRTRSRRRRGSPPPAPDAHRPPRSRRRRRRCPSRSTPSSRPDPVGADQRDVPGRSGRRAAACRRCGRGRRRQRAQPLADQHPGHLGPAGQPGPHRRPAVHLDRVDQVVRRVVQAPPVQLPAQRRLGAVGRGRPAAGRPRPPGRPGRPTGVAGREAAQVGLLA